jgi:hypothetical protein
MANVSQFLGLSASSYSSGNDIGGVTFVKPSEGYWELNLSQSGTPTVILRIGGVNTLLNDGDALVAEEHKKLTFNTPIGTSFSIRLSASVTIDNLTLEFING